jgi:RND family efflux transporter MFP subunit
MNRKWLIGGLAAAALLAIGASVLRTPLVSEALAKVGLGKGKDGKPEVTLEFVAAEIARPERAPIHRSVTFSGPLVAPDTAVLRSKAAGTLLSLSVAEGARVRAGQVLGSIDPTELATRIDERRAMLESARAQAEQAERTHANNQRLADQQFISAAALDSSRAALQTAQAQVAAAQAALGTMHAVRRETTLVAPIAGIVAKRQAVPGEKLAIEQPVLTIVDLSRLELAGSVGTHEVGALAPGLPVQLQVEGVDAPVAGRLLRIAPAAEAGTRAIGVTVGVDNADEKLRAGQYALARVTLPDPAPRLTVPVGAVVNSAGQDYVWVLDAAPAGGTAIGGGAAAGASGVLARRAVTTGRRDGRRVELLDGLRDDATVLALRFDGLREGQKAAVVAARAASSAAPLLATSASAPAPMR